MDLTSLGRFILVYLFHVGFSELITKFITPFSFHSVNMMVLMGGTGFTLCSTAGYFSAFFIDLVQTLCLR